MDVIIIAALILVILILHARLLSKANKLEKRIERIEGRLGDVRDAIDGWEKK